MQAQVARLSTVVLCPDGSIVPNPGLRLPKSTDIKHKTCNGGRLRRRERPTSTTPLLLHRSRRRSRQPIRERRERGRDGCATIMRIAADATGHLETQLDIVFDATNQAGAVAGLRFIEQTPGSARFSDMSFGFFFGLPRVGLPAPAEDRRLQFSSRKLQLLPVIPSAAERSRGISRTAKHVRRGCQFSRSLDSAPLRSG